MEIKFPVNYYVSLRECFVTEITFQIAWERSEVRKSIWRVRKGICASWRVRFRLTSVYYGHNSLQTRKNLVSHFSAQAYKLFAVLPKIIMAPTNWTSSEIIVLETHDSDFAIPEKFYICRDIMHRNLVGDSDVRILPPILFTSKTDLTVCCTDL
jgi:hypothetical protein